MFWHMAEFSDLWMLFGLCVFSLAWGGVGSESQPCVGEGWVATASRARVEGCGMDARAWRGEGWVATVSLAWGEGWEAIVSLAWARGAVRQSAVRGGRVGSDSQPCGGTGGERQSALRRGGVGDNSQPCLAWVIALSGGRLGCGRKKT